MNILHTSCQGGPKFKGAETSVHGMEERFKYGGVASNLVEKVEAFKTVSGKESQRCVFQGQGEEQGNVQCSQPVLP